MLHEFFAQSQGAATAELVLHDITAQSPPGVLFDVYIANIANPNVRKLAGTISWFGDLRHHSMTGPVKETLLFDVTDKLRELGAGNTSDVTVTIEATQGRVPVNSANAQAMRANAVSAFRPQAKLQIFRARRAVPSDELGDKPMSEASMYRVIASYVARLPGVVKEASGSTALIPCALPLPPCF
jgi:Protein of unknown function (DUF_B2219)